MYTIKNKIWILAAFISWFFFTAPKPGQAAVVGTTDDPIDIGGGARPLSLGHAFTAMADDPNSMFANPAGLVGLKSWSGTATSIFLPHTDTYYNIIGGAMLTEYGHLGIGYVGSGINHIDIGGGQYADSFNNVTFVTYASPLSRFFKRAVNGSVGLNFKLFNKGYTGGTIGNAVGFNFDLGLKYYPNNWLTLGMTRRNILFPSLGGIVTWNNGSQEYLPSNTYLGAAAKLADGKYTVDVDAEVPYNWQVPVLWHLGGEWNVTPNFAFRAGADQKLNSTSGTDTTINPALGIGINYKGYRFDYAYHPYYQGFSDTVTSTFSISFMDPIAPGISAIVSKSEVRSGDVQKVIAYAPGDSRDVYAQMPDGSTINLGYDAEKQTWEGNWPVPADIKGKGFVATVSCVDMDYNTWSGNTNPFEVKGQYEAVSLKALVPQKLPPKIDETSVAVSAPADVPILTVAEVSVPAPVAAVEVPVVEEEKPVVAEKPAVIEEKAVTPVTPPPVVVEKPEVAAPVIEKAPAPVTAPVVVEKKPEVVAVVPEQPVVPPPVVEEKPEVVESPKPIIRRPKPAAPKLAGVTKPAARIEKVVVEEVPVTKEAPKRRVPVAAGAAAAAAIAAGVGAYIYYKRRQG